MTRVILVATVILAIAGLFYYSGLTVARPSETEEVRNVVSQFGLRLQRVSLLGPPAVVARSMEEAYGDLVVRELLNSWKENPSRAPGRTTSSPWPDRIEITAVEEAAEDIYRVEGNVIEITSVEAIQGGAAGTYPVALRVERRGGSWRIAEFARLSDGL